MEMAVDDSDDNRLFQPVQYRYESVAVDLNFGNN